MAKPHPKPKKPKLGPHPRRHVLAPYLHSQYAPVRKRAQQLLHSKAKLGRIKKRAHGLGALQKAYGAGGSAGQKEVTDPITSKNIGKEVKAQTQLQYGGARRDIAQSLRENTNQSKHTADWYGQYQKVMAQAGQQQQAAAAQAQGFLGSQAGAQAGLDASVAQQQQRAAQASAATRGAVAGPQVGQVANQALLARQAGAGNFQGLIANQGAASGAYQANQRVVGAAQGLQAQKSGLVARNDVLKKRTQLRSDIGAFKVKTRGDLRSSERQYLLERKAFNLNVAKAGASAANDAAKNRTAAKKLASDLSAKQKARMLANAKFRLDKQKFGAAKAKDAYLKRHGLSVYKPASKSGSGGSGRSGGSGGSGRGAKPRHGLGSLTQGQENTGLDKLDYAVRIFTQHKGKSSGHAVRQWLESGSSSGSAVKGTRQTIGRTPTLFINAAEDIVYRGGISKVNQRRLHAAGYHIKRYPRLKGGVKGVNQSVSSIAKALQGFGR